jgi:predicted GIY-YIG superfamily endonuclease
MFYSYILRSKKDLTYYYGSTQNLRKRLHQHNSGESKYSKVHMPYELIWYCAFLTREKALAFEKYLKSSSGHAFSKKRFL